MPSTSQSAGVTVKSGACYVPERFFLAPAVSLSGHRLVLDTGHGNRVYFIGAYFEGPDIKQTGKVGDDASQVSEVVVEST